MKKRLHECQPGELSHASRHPMARLLLANECVVECCLYDDSGDPAHLWRAWRSARSMGEIPPACLAALVPRLDEAARMGSELRAEQRRARNWLLQDYYREHSRFEKKQKGCASGITEVRRRVAKKHGKTSEVVRQMVLEHEGRGQRGRARC